MTASASAYWDKIRDLIQRVDDSFANPGFSYSVKMYSLVFPVFGLGIAVIVVLGFVALFYRFSAGDWLAYLADALGFGALGLAYLLGYIPLKGLQTIETHHYTRLKVNLDQDQQVLLRALIRLRAKTGVNLKDLYGTDRSIFERRQLVKFLADTGSGFEDWS